MNDSRIPGICRECSECGITYPIYIGHSRIVGGPLLCEDCRKIKVYPCPMCQKTFTGYDSMRRDAKGEFWCEECQDEHDNIDWGEVAERRMEAGE